MLSDIRFNESLFKKAAYLGSQTNEALEEASLVATYRSWAKRLALGVPLQRLQIHRQHLNQNNAIAAISMTHWRTAFCNYKGGWWSGAGEV